MKKTDYMAPEMEILEVMCSKIICASGEEAPDPSDKEYD